MKLCRCHISHATASVRVEYIGIGPCMKIATNATAIHRGSQGHSRRSASKRSKRDGIR